MKSIYSFVFLILLNLQAFGLHVKSGEGKIGNKAVLEYTKKLFIVSPNDSSVCTGTFLDEKTLLTAAHCLYDEKTGTKLVTVAIPEYEDGELVGEEMFDGEEMQVIPHPTYVGLSPYAVEATALFDIGIIKFKEPVFKGPFVKLYDFEEGEKLDAFPETTRYYAIGGGSKTYYFFDPTKHLKDFVDTFTRGIRGTSVKIKNADAIYYGQTRKGAMVCVGDSGGPLLIQNEDKSVYQVGVLSLIQGFWMRFRFNPCARNFRATGLNSRHLKWIKKMQAAPYVAPLKPEDITLPAVY